MWQPKRGVIASHSTQADHKDVRCLHTGHAVKLEQKLSAGGEGIGHRTISSSIFISSSIIHGFNPLARCQSGIP